MGALDRIVLAAARELADLRITANVVNPGPVDTKWMTPEQPRSVAADSPRGRVGLRTDSTALVAFPVLDGRRLDRRAAAVLRRRVGSPELARPSWLA